MGQKIKQSITISLLDDRGKIRLRWRYNTNRYTLSTSLDYNPENQLSLNGIIKSIKQDIRKKCFDTALDKYRQLLPSFKANKPDKPVITAPTIVTSIKQEKPHNKAVISDFELWTKDYRQKDCDQHIDYNATRNMLKRWGLFKIPDALQFLNKETFNYKTYNRRLNLLQAFFKWAVKHKGYQCNPFDDVLPKTGKKPKRPQREPLTAKEMNDILDAVKNDTYVKKSSHYKHSHYYPFLYFIFKTGVRNAEAVGIRVKHIDQEKKLITIEEALARNLNKTNGNARIRKETKNGKIRKIPLDDDLKAVIQPLMDGKNPDDLLFLSYTGLPIDDKMFQRRVLRPLMKELKIPIRDLYAARHGFTTRAIANNINPVIVAFMLGNNPETALRNYTHLQELPKQLPSF